jgi:ribosomal protein S18 acetylase RimI-like enzyme
LSTIDQQASDRFAIPANLYNFKQLADLYNRTRVDYIVPMPMNAKRMADYVLDYDVCLEASVIALNSDRTESGLGMVSFRESRGWITRLGIIPELRKQRLGHFLMEWMLDQAGIRGIEEVQLEVIKGNMPAHSMFIKFGFQETRELLVIRRPPGSPDPDLAGSERSSDYGAFPSGD